MKIELLNARIFISKNTVVADAIADALDGKIEIKTAELIQFDFSGAAKF